MSEVGLVVNDFHCGNYWSIMPRTCVEVLGDEEVERHPTDLQLTLNDLWDSMKEEIGRIDFVIANGDLCEGPNRREYGLGNWTTSLLTQVDAAADLLAGLRAKKYAVTEGSGYHVGPQTTLDQQVAEALKAKTNAEIQYGPDIEVVVGDQYRIHACHNIGVSQVFHYRTTPLARELLNARVNDEEYGKFDGLVRAHAHYYCYVEFGKSWGAIVPGWKMKDEYLRRKGLGFLPKIGWFALEIDGSDVVNKWINAVTPEKKGLVQEFHV